MPNHGRQSGASRQSACQHTSFRTLNEAAPSNYCAHCPLYIHLPRSPTHLIGERHLPPMYHAARPLRVPGYSTEQLYAERPMTSES